ncbi:MAG: transcriptional regulator [Lysinibacillus sp.]
MIDYRLGYEYYRKVCEEHKVIPINYHYYLLNLSQEQLDAYNEQAVKQGGALEYELR